MVCSLFVTPDGRRDSRQGVVCGNEVLNNWRNLCTSRWVSLEDMSASMFSTPGMRLMDAWIFARHMVHAAYQRMGPMAIAVAVLTLPRRAQISAVVLSTPVAMCSSGAMRGAKRWR